MNDAHEQSLPAAVDWDPRSDDVLKDQIAAYDDMRARCPVARSAYGYTTFLKHADVLAAALDHETYSNAVSRYPSVPNGMDPPAHTPLRRLIEPYFNEERMQEFEPVCRQIAMQLVDALPRDGATEFMDGFASEFALQIQSAFLGWPVSLHEPLKEWTAKNHAATLARDTDAMADIAMEFDGYIRDLLASRRQAGDDAPDDATTRLMRETVEGRPLTDEEIVSILRNWTVGELATISASVGILAQYLAEHPEIQEQLRQQPELISAANDEILRIHAPLLMNRRVLTKPTTVAGRQLAEGERIVLLWASANRDETVFGDPDEFRLDRDPALNLLYGAGVHVCPGAPLARMELRIVMECLLSQAQWTLVAHDAPIRAHFPASGYAHLPLHMRRLA